MIKTIRALFRIRHLMLIEETARRVVDEIGRHDQKLNGTPPLYNDAQPPDGDDYNEIWSMAEELRKVL